MSATTVSNIVASMEALMGQVKELQARAAAVEALAHNRGAVMEVQAHVSAEYERRTWAAISSALSAEERNGLHTHEAVQKMAAELIKLRAAAAAPAGGSSAPPAPQAAPPAPPGVAALAAEVAEQKKQEAKQDAELMAAVPGDVKRKLAWRFTGAGSTKKGEETWPYYKEERALAAVAVLLKEYGVKAEAESVAGTDLWHVTVSEEQMERLKAAVMK